ncbi:MAG TPA: hypothetical protein VF093_00515 [Solirubrobacterales bacterium]
MALGPGGEIFVLFANAAPCAGFGECTIEWSLARFSPDGVRDSAFGSGPGSALAVHGSEYEPADLAVGPDGRPVVAAFDEGRVVLARFDRGGHLEAMLGAGEASALLGYGYRPPLLAVQGDGKVVVAVGSFEELSIVRYLPNGERDPGFGAGGETRVAMGMQSHPAELLLRADGRIALAISRCCGGSPLSGEGVGFVQLLANGQPDPALNGSGQVLLPTPGARGNVEAAALASDNGAYIVFEMDMETVATTGHVVKLRPDGAVDTAFARDGFSRIPMPGVDDLVIDGKGRLVASGWNGGAAVLRTRPGGGADRTFGGGAPVPLKSSGPAGVVALQAKGKIVALGEPCCGPKGASLYRLTGGTDHTRCLGRKATFVGTNGRDEITGTPRRDVIAALGGRDEVLGLGGRDVICGGKGKDDLFGGPGRDEVKP